MSLCVKSDSSCPVQDAATFCQRMCRTLPKTRVLYVYSIRLGNGVVYLSYLQLSLMELYAMKVITSGTFWSLSLLMSIGNFEGCFVRAKIIYIGVWGS